MVFREDIRSVACTTTTCPSPVCRSGRLLSFAGGSLQKCMYSPMQIRSMRSLGNAGRPGPTDTRLGTAFTVVIAPLGLASGSPVRAVSLVPALPSHAMSLLAGKSLPAANVRSPTAASSSACRSLPPFYVTPERVLDVFRWWKQHNPLYADIETNQDWVVDAIHDDHNLYASLTSVYCLMFLITCQS